LLTPSFSRVASYCSFFTFGLLNIRAKAITAPLLRFAERPDPPEKGRAGAAYFPREVFFFGFGFPGMSLPPAAARFFCFFVATDPPRLGAIRNDADVTRLASRDRANPCGCFRQALL